MGGRNIAPLADRKADFSLGSMLTPEKKEECFPSKGEKARDRRKNPPFRQEKSDGASFFSSKGGGGVQGNFLLLPGEKKVGGIFICVGGRGGG